jgi:hypothetical protein
MAGSGRLVAGLTAFGLTLALACVVVLWMALAWPDETGDVAPDPRAGLHVQSVLAQLFLREAGLTSRQDPLVLTAGEVNAFLAGHVEVRDPPVWPVRVEISPDGVELGGATSLGRLMARVFGSAPARMLPGFVAGHQVWLTARGQIAVVSPGRGEFRAHAATIGRQRVPVAVLWRMLGGRPVALVWRMPRVVERIDAEPGRLLIRTRRPGRGLGAPG